jgi:hypothetical protein
MTAGDERVARKGLEEDAHCPGRSETFLLPINPAPAGTALDIGDDKTLKIVIKSTF